MAILSVVFVSLLSVWVWNEIFLRFARRLGALSQGIPHQRRWDSQRKPIIGGIAFFTVALGLAAWRPENMELSRSFLAGGAIAFLTGLADDAFIAVPYLKLMGQIAAASAALLWNAPLLHAGDPFFSFALTLFWYVAVMNAFNMMDNMDGTAGSIAFVLLAGTPWLLPQSPHVLLYMGMVGALLAFLFRNWHPSRLYMGDNGSQFVGFTLAYWGTELWNAQPTTTPTWVNLAGLIALFALLAGDTFWVIVSRLYRGQSPFHGGTDHLTHRLAQGGWNVGPIAFVLALLQGGLLLLYGWGGTLFSPDRLILSLLTIGGVGVGIGYVHLRHLLVGLRLSRFRQPV